MISIPSYPAFFASAAVFAKSVAVRSTPRLDRACGLKGVIGDCRLLADTVKGW